MSLTEVQRREIIESFMDFGILRLGVDGMFHLGNLEFVRNTGGMEVVQILGKLVTSTNNSIEKDSLILRRGELPYFHVPKETRRKEIQRRKK